MKRAYLTAASKLIVLSMLVISCVKDNQADVPAGDWSDGAPLDMTVSFESFTAGTRLAELSGPDDMAIDAKGLKNVGLYVYYTSDYEAGDLSRPYIRNMECTVTGEKLRPVLTGVNDADDYEIFIYDQMTLVAFYPYNEAMSLEENWIGGAGGMTEDDYIITLPRYADQVYIPYKAVTTTNPTISYYTRLHFYPVHTYKIEIVVVSEDDLNALPVAGEIKILPNIAPADNTELAVDDIRERWWDGVEIMQNGGGGSHVGQYVSYIWTSSGLGVKNDIERGEVLIQSDKLTLIASEDIAVQQDHVYRYGYNLTTGEIFIPTSSRLVHDRPTLELIKGMNGDAYQVCDIDLSGGDWIPIHIVGGRYDGGGHMITGMQVNTSGAEAGLFSHVQGNTTVCNVNLVEPRITVNSTEQECFVGGIAGKLNTTLSEADKQALIANLPPGLSDVVRQEILKQLLAEHLNSNSNISASRVIDPVITVNGAVPHVGTIVGKNGEVNEDEYYHGNIWDTYSIGGSIVVNEGNEQRNAGGFTGGFCGLNNGNIYYSYTTIDRITFEKLETVDNGNGPELVRRDAAQGFTTYGTEFPVGDGQIIVDCYSILPDANTAEVQTLPGAWPGWGTYTGKWPILTLGWNTSPTTSMWYDMGSVPDNYPVLQWERR